MIEAQRILIVWILYRMKRRDLHSYINYAMLTGHTNRTYDREKSTMAPLAECNVPNFDYCIIGIGPSILVNDSSAHGFSPSPRGATVISCNRTPNAGELYWISKCFCGSHFRTTSTTEYC